MFTFDLGPEAPPGEHLAVLLDREADRAGRGNRDCGHVLFVRALAAAVARLGESGTGQVSVPLDEASAYRVRDMLDSVLAATGSAHLRQLLGQFDAYTSWNDAQARQRDTDNGLQVRARTAV